MYIETKDIGPEGLVVDRSAAWHMPPPREGDDEVKVDQIRLSGEVHRDEDRYLFTGDIATVATLVCGRCLEPFTLPLDMHFDLTYTARPDRPGRHGEQRVDVDSITEVPFDGARIDLDALLAEQIYLALPLKPLCREDCHGLCARCGANLNVTACSCPAGAEPDPRLAVLKRLV
ncbi:MAG TPA: DUF177 domain-containing protein [Candidatus Polarisedimenticolia bacterium]|nr:DUF177 domain-containing protein [Candidatus Polarisedimenticolia bacterium]